MEKAIPAMIMNPPEMLTERRLAAQAWEAWTRRILDRQRRDGSADDGAFHEYEHGWHDGRYTALAIPHLIAARLWHGEVAAAPDRLEAAIMRAMRFVLRRQRDDGQLDLGGAYSPNEAGFPIPALAEAYRRLREFGGSWAAELAALVETYIRRAAEAVLAGHAYTANHRWAAAAGPLAAAHSLFPDPRYLAKIEEYLADGIDCDGDGCWHEERGVGYNNVANHGMLVLADSLGRREFLDPVIRNLRFMLFNVQPSGMADTSYSFRQDRGSLGCRPCDYRLARRAALESGDGRIATLAHMAGIREPNGGDLMPLLFELDRRPGPLPAPQPLPTDYEKQFAKIGVCRRRAGDTALTLAADTGGHFFDSVRDQFGGPRCSEDWFRLEHAGITIASLQLAVAQMRCIQPNRLEAIATGEYRLAGEVAGWSHTLHFRPGWPRITMPWGLRHSIAVHWRGDSLYIRLHGESQGALAASLRLWLAPGVRFREGATSRELLPKESLDIAGGQPVRFEGDRGAIEIRGLPAAAHQMPVGGEPAIPSALSDQCALLRLGLRMPVALELEMRLLPPANG